MVSLIAMSMENGQSIILGASMTKLNEDRYAFCDFDILKRGA
jgi:hypothetical protein